MSGRVRLSLRKSASTLTESHEIRRESPVSVGSLVWDQLSSQTKDSGIFEQHDSEAQFSSNAVVLEADSFVDLPLPIRLDKRCSVSDSTTTVERLEFVASVLRQNPKKFESLLSADPQRFEKLAKRTNEVSALLKGTVRIRGTGIVGEQTLRILRRVGVNPVAFAELEPDKREFCGLPIVRLDKIPEDEPIVIGTARHCNDVLRDLGDRGFQNVMTLPEVFATFEELGQPESAFAKIDAVSKDKWWHLLLTVSDATSARTLLTLSHYRSTLDTRILDEAIVEDHTQWFDPVVLQMGCSSFLDCGAYDGDTIEEFKLSFPNFVKAIGMEPDPLLAKRAIESHARDRRIRIINAAVGDVDGEVQMAMTQGMDGTTSTTSERSLVRMVTLDSILEEFDFNQRPIYLKVDVEGAETKVLQGAVNLISSHKPVIGIASYHRADDLWKITQQISSIAPGYRFYVRHYTPMTFETVIYAIPNP